MRTKGQIQKPGRASAAIALSLMLALLAGCGGGGGSGGSTSAIPTASASGNGSGGTTTPPPPAPPVPPPNQPPTISGTPATTAVEGSNYSFQPTAGDPDGNTLTYSATGLPTWLTINASSGLVSGTVPAGAAGTYNNLVVSVSDGQASASLPSFSLTITAPVIIAPPAPPPPAPAPPPPAPPPNAAPTISGSPATTATVGKAYAFQPTASDADNQTLRFGIANKPAWAEFDIVTGRLSGTPAEAHLGTHGSIVISVSDGTASATLPAFSITVEAAPVENRAPTISGSPAITATEESAYSFQPTASDPDGDPLTFSVSGAPAWLRLDGKTGRLSGTPPTGSAGSVGPIVISVSDGKLSASLPAFTITVSAKPNVAPTITGTPATSAVAGQTYMFQATATDPDSQTLRFGIANKPAWAEFDIVTGRLSGTPTAADVGSYGNIVISVSDGKDSATLPAFAITVTAPPAAGVAELQWTAPTMNEDGSALTNLAGYRVRYGTSPTTLDKVLDVGSPSMTSARIEGLAAGTWYFTVASYTNTGVESAPTSAVSKTIS